MTNIKINIPKDANHLIHILQNHDYKAYICGGAVRDSILNRPVHDWDLCTSATPEEMIEIFKDYHVIPTGLKHGTITVMLHGKSYEITTFRKEAEYSDSRHPDKVEFVTDITEDLSRRDFTINAIAYNDEEGLIDSFDGAQDLLYKTIRCVGNAKERFTEDALRILRAIRFAAILGFDIDNSTSIQIHSLKDHIKDISWERITSEFCKIAQTNQFHEMLYFYTDVFTVIIPEIEPMLGFNQRNPYHQYDVFMHTLHALENCPSDDLITKLSVFFHDFGKPKSAVPDVDDPNRLHFYGHGEVSTEMTNEIMRRMKFDNETRKAVVELVYYHDSAFEVSEKHVRRWLNKIGPEQFKRLLDVREADIRGQRKEVNPERIEKVEKIRALLDEILEKDSCFSMKDLAVNGKHLIELGYVPGKELGNMLNTLLQMVIDGDIENDITALLSIADKKLNYNTTEYIEDVTCEL